jgi:hypothetical protein
MLGTQMSAPGFTWRTQIPDKILRHLIPKVLPLLLIV